MKLHNFRDVFIIECKAVVDYINEACEENEGKLLEGGKYVIFRKKRTSLG
jgi:hypothetical protein